jgi:hypothetical protein
MSDDLNQPGTSSSQSTNSATENDTYRFEDANDLPLNLKYHNDHVALVKDTDPHKLMFDFTSISKLRNKQSSTLKLVSPHHVSKAFCYIPETMVDWNKGCTIRPCITNVNDDDETFELTWKYDGTYLSTYTPDGNEWVLDVDHWNLVDRQRLGIVREKVGSNRKGPGQAPGRSFILRDD